MVAGEGGVIKNMEKDEEGWGRYLVKLYKLEALVSHFHLESW